MTAAVLGFDRSVTGRRWIGRGGGGVDAERLGLAIAQRFGLPEIVGRLIALRGVGLDEVERFLEPTLKAELPDPSLLRDMDAAASRLADAVQRGGTVGLFAASAVDGAPAGAQMARTRKSVRRG